MDIEKQMKHIECGLSDTDLFTPTIVQTDIVRSTYEEIYPTTKLDDNGPIDFTLENNTEKFLDFSNCYIKAKLQIVKNDGGETGDDDHVTSTNYTIASVFRQIDVMLNGSIVSDSTNTYGYRAYIETLLNFGKESKKTQLDMGLYTKDKQGKFDVVQIDGENPGFNERHSLTARSKIVSICGRPHIDIAHQGRLILNGMPVKITLHRQRDTFALLAGGESPNYKIKLLDVVFCIRKVELAAHMFKEIQQKLEKEPVVYPINRATVKTRSIAAGLTSLNWDNAIMGQIPSKVIIGMVENNAFTGSFKKNPYNFQCFKYWRLREW